MHTGKYATFNHRVKDRENMKLKIQELFLDRWPLIHLQNILKGQYTPKVSSTWIWAQFH